MARPGPFPPGRAVSPVAAGDRRQRGPQPPAVRRSSRGARAPGGRGAAAFGWCGFTSGGRRPARGAARRAARRAGAAERRRPRGARLPAPARSRRGGDRRGAGHPPRDREVADLARARAAARGAWGGAVSDLVRELELLGDEIAWPDTPAFVPRAAPAPARRSRRPSRRLILVIALGVLALAAGALAATGVI